jgi:hypothetical protein
MKGEGRKGECSVANQIVIIKSECDCTEKVPRKYLEST